MILCTLVAVRQLFTESQVQRLKLLSQRGIKVALKHSVLKACMFSRWWKNTCILTRYRVDSQHEVCYCFTAVTCSVDYSMVYRRIN